MRRSPLLPMLVPLLAFLATPAAAQEGPPVREGDTAADSARVVDRVDSADAELMIVTRTGDVALALVGRELLFQPTDLGLELRGTEKEREAEESESSLLASVMGSMARAGLKRLLDHAIAYPVDEIRYAEWEDDRLLLEGRDGELFNITVNDREVMADFRESDARRLVREIRRLQDR